MEENLQRGIIKQAEKEEGLNRNLKHNKRLKFWGGGLKMKALKIKGWYKRAKKNGGNFKKMLQNLRFSSSKGYKKGHIPKHSTDCQKTTDAKHNLKINKILPIPEKLETKAWGQSGMVPRDATSET